MDNKLITVEKEDGTIEQMEATLIFKLESTGKDYIIYKSLDKDEYYAAAFNKELEYTDLDTNLSEEEQKQIQEVFNQVVKGGKPNA